MSGEYFGFNTTQAKTLDRLLGLLVDIPTEDPGDGVTVWNDDGALKVSVETP